MKENRNYEGMEIENLLDIKKKAIEVAKAYNQDAI